MSNPYSTRDQGSSSNPYDRSDRSRTPNTSGTQRTGLSATASDFRPSGSGEAHTNAYDRQPARVYQDAQGRPVDQYGDPMRYDRFGIPMDPDPLNLGRWKPVGTPGHPLPGETLRDTMRRTEAEYPQSSWMMEGSRNYEEAGGHSAQSMVGRGSDCYQRDRGAGRPERGHRERGAGGGSGGSDPHGGGMRR